MPLTFPAHQAPVLPLKLWRPNWFDGTALCVGAAAPDLPYALGAWTNTQSHSVEGILLWAVPFTLLVCAVLRWRAVAGIFAHLPDAGCLRLRSYRVLGRQRPALSITLLSALLGAASHVVIDAFTHTGRWGAEWLGLDVVIAELPLRGEFTLARTLQYLGHVGGSLFALALFARIGRQRLLERWYGAEAVDTARSVAVTPAQRLAFWAIALTVPLAAGAASISSHRGPVFVAIGATCLGLLLAGTLPLYRERQVRQAVRKPAPAWRRWLKKALLAAALVACMLLAVMTTAVLYILLDLPGAASYMSD